MRILDGNKTQTQTKPQRQVGQLGYFMLPQTQTKQTHEHVKH